MCQKSLILLTDSSCTLSMFPPSVFPLLTLPPLTLMRSPQLSSVHVREVATHRRIGCREPAHYPTPKRACHRGRRPDCYWPTLDTCSAHLQARAKVKQEQPGTAGAGDRQGEGGKGGVHEVEGQGQPCWNGISNIIMIKYFCILPPRIRLRSGV